MKKSDKTFSEIIYVAITLISIIVALFFVDFGIFNNFPFQITDIAIFCSTVLLVHAIKFFRLYFIILEDMLPINVALRAYVKTTFVSILIPFKIGELYRMYVYGYKLNNYSKGVYSIIIDKYFDAVILAILFLSAKYLSIPTNTTILAILLTFIVIVTFIYKTFDSTYRYLNRFLLARGGGSKSLNSLKALEHCHNIHKNIKQMVHGRQLICLVLSALAWSIECLGIVFISRSIMPSDIVAHTTNYISQGFFGISNNIMSIYTLCCAIVFLIAIVIIYAYQITKFAQRRKK